MLAVRSDTFCLVLNLLDQCVEEIPVKDLPHDAFRLLSDMKNIPADISFPALTF